MISHCLQQWEQQQEIKKTVGEGNKVIHGVRHDHWLTVFIYYFRKETYDRIGLF